MIALNEIIENKQWFENRLALMGKAFSLEKIINLETKFICFDSNANKLRSECNKLCTQVADFINKNQNTKELIKKINNMDKHIKSLERKSNRAMNRINRLLLRLPNPATNTNDLNIVIQSTENIDFSHSTFLNSLKEIINLKKTNKPIKSYLLAQKNMVLKEENLPYGVVNSNNKSFEILLFLDGNADDIQTEIEKLLKINAKYLIDKSIQTLSKNSNRELLAILSDKSRITFEIWGEYVSRDIGLKFYSKQTDMTKFVKMIRIISK